MATERRSGAPKGIRAYLVQVAVLTNHQNGRDTHVRQIKIYGPRKCVAACVHRMRVHVGCAVRADSHGFFAGAGTCCRRRGTAG